MIVYTKNVINMTRIVRKAVAAQQNNNRARGGFGSDRQIFHSEFNQLFAEELDNYNLDSVVTVTYTEVQTLINDYIAGNGVGLVAGTHYKLSDKGDKGIILLAVAPNQFSLEGQGIFLNPDFQGVGDYSGVSGYNVTRGVWYEDGENLAIFVNGDIVFWNGLHYKLVDDQSVNLTNPSLNGGAYEVLPKSTANVGYIEEVDFILYDFDNDIIIERHDKRRNVVKKHLGAPNITNFQWGNDTVKGNTINTLAYINCINQKGSMYNNVFTNTTISMSNFTGTLSSCNIFNLSSFNLVDSTATFQYCYFDYQNIAISIDSGTFNNNSISPLGSTFEANLLTSDYEAGTETLTIPSNLNYVGIFTLDKNIAVADPILKIINPCDHRIRIYSEQGGSNTFKHTAANLAVIDDLISDAAAANVLNGDYNDFIEYEKTTIAGGVIVNRRYNAVIAA